MKKGGNVWQNDVIDKKMWLNYGPVIFQREQKILKNVGNVLLMPFSDNFATKYPY